MYASERDLQTWDEWQRYATRLSDIPEAATRVLFYREGKSHQGLAAFRNVTMLKARQVDQDFLNEIAELRDLTFLELDAVTADDLSPLCRLTRLKTLKIEDVRKARDFAPLVTLSSLDKLFVINAKAITNLEFLAEANGLTSLGVEGGMWTKQQVDSLKPLSHLKSLRALFLTSVVLRDARLHYLATIPHLRVLECAKFSSEEQFGELRGLMPHLECRWCDEYDASAP